MLQVETRAPKLRGLEMLQLKLEALEQRALLAADLLPRIDGTDLAFKGDEVSCVLTVTNQGDETGTKKVEAGAFPPLIEARWAFDGGTSSTIPPAVELEPGESRTFTLTGQVPASAEWSVFVWASVEISGGSTYGAEHSTVVLNGIVDSSNIGVASMGQLLTTSAKGVTVYSGANFHSAEPAGDVNDDGIDDAFLHYASQQDVIVDGMHSFTWEFIRYTIRGTTSRNPRLHLMRGGGESLDTWSGQGESPRWFKFDFHPFGNKFTVGDIDGDGFDDILATDPHALASSGTATILFGPDFRDNFVIVGSLRPDRPGSDILLGQGAGPVGDINNDGFGDFYVRDRYVLSIVHGRDFDRELLGDFDQDGAVTLRDFLVIADNFGSDTAVRSDGDLDGDARVTFSDFLIFGFAFARGRS